MRYKGGNTDTIYAVEDAHLMKSKELVDNHPDCAVVKVKFGRQHHHVDYTIFKHLMPEKKTVIESFDYELDYV